MSTAAPLADPRAPERSPGLGASLGAVFVTAIVGVAVAGEKWLVVAAVLAVLAGAVVLALPRQFVVVTIALYASELLVPEPSHQLYLFVLALVPVVVWRSLDRLWSGERQPWTWQRALTIAFMILTLAIMVVRGVGFQALGGAKAGGLLYVRLLASAGMALLLPGVRLSDAQWRRALTGMCALSVLPFVADLSAVYVRPLAAAAAALFHLSPSVEGLVFGATTDGGAFRWFSAMSVSAYFTLWLFLRERSESATTRLSPAIVMGLLGAFAVASFSGHRLALVNVLGITGLVLLLDGRLTLRRAAAGAVVVVLVLGVLALFADALPPAVQRAISWVPGVQVSAEAGRSASDSVTWRLAVWILALQEVPKYLWVGRGLAYDRGDATLASSAHLMSGEANWAIVQGYFHNGWLSLLILFGLAGLVLGLALLTTIATRHVRLTKAVWHRTELRRFHRVLTAWLLLQVVTYWLIYGDVQVSFPQLFFTVALLEALRSDDRATSSTLNAAALERAAG